MIMPTGADWTTILMASIAEKLVSFFTNLLCGGLSLRRCGHDFTDIGPKFIGQAASL